MENYHSWFTKSYSPSSADCSNADDNLDENGFSFEMQKSGEITSETDSNNIHKD